MIEESASILINIHRAPVGPCRACGEPGTLYASTHRAGQPERTEGSLCVPCAHKLLDDGVERARREIEN